MEHCLWHPSEEIRGSKGQYLSGYCIAIGLTGSVALYRSLDTARWLVRRGARVVFVATRPALELVGPKLLEWATGERPVTELGGRVEHVSLAKECDGMLIAPATLSTLAKTAYGMIDNPVAALAVSMIGLRKPVIVAPAMHANLMSTRQYSRAVEELASQDVIIVPPRVEEGVAKYPSPWLLARVTSAVVRSGRDLAGRRVLVTTGASREWIDPVRFISNPSSGAMGVEVAVEAWARGAEVTLVHGYVTVELPHMIKLVPADTTDEMRRAVDELTSKYGYDVLVAAAAPVDFRPSEYSIRKIRSGERLVLELEPTPKVIEGVRERLKLLVAFAAETVESREELASAAVEKMEKYGADIIVANRVGAPGVGFASESLDALLLWRDGDRLVREDLSIVRKEIVASRLLDTVVRLLR
jgi:phosphopantothenoylcysteine decarboxylase/phosphopantothenate--cysteine ligase